MNIFKAINNTYLCSVIILQNREIDGNVAKQYFKSIIRKVPARSNEEAIGKFLQSTSEIKRIETLLPVECFLLKDLTEIK